MAKTVKHYEIFICYKVEERTPMAYRGDLKPDHLSKNELSKTDDTFEFYNTNHERIIIMKSVISTIRVKPIYETET